MENRALGTILNEAWCITPAMLETIISIAKRETDVEAVEFKLGSPLQNTHTATQRGNIAVIPVVGSIMRYGNIMTRVSGATSLSVLAQDFEEAENNNEIETIVLRVDTPGGQASGISEFADRIRASQKRVIAYVDSQCASAGYWIASACDEIVASKTSMIGSIGVVFALQNTNKQDEQNGVENIEIVSNVSPKKRPDITSEEGKSQIQKWADELGYLFVEAVATFRGVSQDTVLENFGQGDMFIAKEAVKVGMIDRLGDFEGLMLEIQKKGVLSTQIMIGDSMTLEELQTSHAALYTSIVSEAEANGAKLERERIKNIDSVNAKGFENIISAMKFDGVSTVENVKSALFDAKEEDSKKMFDRVSADTTELEALVGEISSVEASDLEQINEVQAAFAQALKTINGE